MRTSRRSLLAGVAGLALLPTMSGAAPRLSKRPNVLFIGVDDLSPRLGSFGDAHAVTPHIDRLASRGTTFQKAYCQQAVSGPSRASQLTGCRPDTTGVSLNGADYTPNFIGTFSQTHPTTPTWFAQHGYHVRVGGKVHHEAQEQIERATGDPIPVPPGHWTDYFHPESEAQRQADERNRPIFESPDVADDAYNDGFLAKQGAAILREHAAGDGETPLFLAIGFRKPHLPFNCPKKYWDLYDPNALPLSPAPHEPAGAPPWTTGSYELANRYEHHYTRDTPIDESVARRLRHGYYACTSYTDACVGTLLDALDEAGLADDTIVVLWVDHGFHLGDNGMWGKHNNYEVATRVPLIFAGPGVAEGRRVEALTEMLNVYPTLCDLAGVAKPAYLEGTSLVPQIDGATPDEAEQAAFSQYPHRSAVGYAVRTPRWRYVEWRNNERAMADVGQAENTVRLRELYDHAADPHETTNVAADHPEAVAELAVRLSTIFGDNAGEGAA